MCRFESPGFGGGPEEEYSRAFADRFLWLVGPQNFYVPKYFTVNQPVMTPCPFGVTHLQKRSRFGFLLMWPFCLHVWWMWRPQARPDAGSGWLPGTERGIYARTPGYRWEGSTGTYIRTKGYVGPHWD